jgi:hypothetical protein
MPVLQSTNRVKLSKVRETTFGVTPANPVFKAVRETSSSLAANPKTVISAEIRPDRPGDRPDPGRRGCGRRCRRRDCIRACSPAISW